jgi:hypothetical protein
MKRAMLAQWETLGALIPLTKPGLGQRFLPESLRSEAV